VCLRRYEIFIMLPLVSISRHPLHSLRAMSAEREREREVTDSDAARVFITFCALLCHMDIACFTRSCIFNNYWLRFPIYLFYRRKECGCHERVNGEASYILYSFRLQKIMNNPSLEKSL